MGKSVVVVVVVVVVPRGGAEGVGGVDGGTEPRGGSIITGITGCADVTLAGGVTITVGALGETITVEAGAAGETGDSGWLLIKPEGGAGFGGSGAGANAGGTANVGPADMPGPCVTVGGNVVGT